MYAITTVALRDTPAMQCTNTFPFAKFFYMNSFVIGKYCFKFSLSMSSIDIISCATFPSGKWSIRC